MDSFGKIKIDAHVVKQLGDELITDHEQAILEIVKNSYDADATYCYVSIDTSYTEMINGELVEGKITFTDNGHGMSEDEIDRGWLTISYSGKRELKERNQKTAKNRNYQGDKGLGRLSTMRLGRFLRISTFKDGESFPSYVELDWEKFSQGNTLDSIDVIFKSLTSKKLPVGTQLDVIGLYDSKRWTEKYASTRLQAQLSKLLSPYGHLGDFVVSLTIDGDEVDSRDLPKDISKLSLAKFNYSFDGQTLEMSGSARLPFFKGMKGDITKGYDQFIKPDRGKSLFEWLLSVPRLKDNYEIKYSEDEGWFIEFRAKKDWDYINSPGKEIKNPGAFSGEWDYLFFSGPAFSELEIQSGLRLGPLVDSIKSYSGIRLYRDGFAIGNTQGDWVGLSSDKTSGLGFYSLRPDNTFGYLYFDGYETIGLKETSDRQGLIENEVYDGLMALVKELIGFSNVFLNVSRKESNKFVAFKRAQEVKPQELPSVPEALDNIEALGSGLVNTFKDFEQRSEALNIDFQYVEAKIEESRFDLVLDEKSKQTIEKIEGYVSNLRSSYQKFKDTFDNRVADIKDLEVSAILVSQELKYLNDKLDSYYELAAIGLSASTLSHDINSQLDSIYKNCSSIISTVKGMEGDNKKVLVSQVNKVRATTRTIAKDVSLLNPMLRGRRERLDEIILSDGVRDYFDLVEHSLSSKGISVDLQLLKSIKVSFNPGKLYQILDNLVRNSEYWLSHFESEISNKVIFVRTTDFGIRIWDSGKGIREGVSEKIFEMFVSDKSDGQGLGLYIVSNLLRERGAKISLLEDRNEYGRRYVFELDFSNTAVKGA